MRTADTIAQQQEQQSLNAGKKNKRGNKRGTHPNSLKALIPTQYVPGVSGNPGGQPGYDVGAALARAVIEGFQGQAYEGLGMQLAKGNAYTFKELCERGYGPKPQQIQHTGQDGGPIQSSIQVTFVNPDATNG